MTSSEEKYADIMNVKYTPSDRRAHMRRIDRAAQFAPFAALTGFEDQLDESARLTDARTLPSAEVTEALNDALRILDRRILSQPFVHVVYFKADARKSGGHYVEKRGRLKKIDTVAATLLFTDGAEIPMEDLRVLET